MSKCLKLYIYIMLSKRIICFLLTAVLLLADSGQMIYAHTCFKSHQTAISLSKTSTACCKTVADKVTHQARLQKSSCCSVNSQYIKQAPGSEMRFDFSKLQLPVQPVALFVVENVPVLLKSPQGLIHTSNLSSNKSNSLYTSVFRC